MSLSATPPHKSPAEDCAKQSVLNQPPLLMLTPALAVTPVFAKSCLREAGCTDAGTGDEPQNNFAEMSFYQSQPEPSPVTNDEPEQRARSVKKKKAETADPEPVKEKSVFDTVSGFFFGEARAIPPPPPTPIFIGVGSAAEAVMAAAAGGAVAQANQDAAKALTKMTRLSGPKVWQERIGMNLSFVLMGAVLQSWLKGEKNDLMTPGQLLSVAEKSGTVPDRVRYNWVEDAETGRMKPVGYHTEAGSGRDQVKVRLLTERPGGRYEFREDGQHTALLIARTPADAPGTSDAAGWHTGNDAEPVGSVAVPGLEYPDIQGLTITTTPVPEEKDFRLDNHRYEIKLQTVSEEMMCISIFREKALVQSLRCVPFVPLQPKHDEPGAGNFVDV